MLRFLDTQILALSLKLQNIFDSLHLKERDEVKKKIKILLGNIKEEVENYKISEDDIYKKAIDLYYNFEKKDKNIILNTYAEVLVLLEYISDKWSRFVMAEEYKKKEKMHSKKRKEKQNRIKEEENRMTFIFQNIIKEEKNKVKQQESWRQNNECELCGKKLGLMDKIFGHLRCNGCR